MLKDPSSETLAWLRTAARDPSRRLPRHLPERLSLGAAHAQVQTVAASALPQTEVGGVLLLGGAGVEARADLTWLAHYPPEVDGLPFLGTFHVHPEGMPPTFAPEDLGHCLRSDNPGFLDLLVAGDKLICLVRTNPFVYVAAHRVDRDPLVLGSAHEEYRRSLGALRPEDPGYARYYRSATLYLCARYRVAYYEGPPTGPLERAFVPEAPP